MSAAYPRCPTCARQHTAETWRWCPWRATTIADQGGIVTTTERHACSTCGTVLERTTEGAVT